MSTFDTIQPPADLPPRHAGWQLLPDGLLIRDGLAILPGPDQDRKARVADWWARWFVGRTVTGGAQWERRRITQTELDL